MSSNLNKKVEKISQLLDRLATESAKGIPIIVEGQNDVKTLHELGVKGDIISAKSSGKSFLDILSEVEKRGKRDVIILTDFDRRGKELVKRLAQNLERAKVTPNLLFWNRLNGLVGREVKDIEGLATYMETLSRKLGL